MIILFYTIIHIPLLLNTILNIILKFLKYFFPLCLVQNYSSFYLTLIVYLHLKIIVSVPVCNKKLVHLVSPVSSRVDIPLDLCSSLVADSQETNIWEVQDWNSE